MWTVILIAIISLVVIVSKFIYDGEFIKGKHRQNFSVFLACILITTIITCGGFFATFLSTIIALNNNSNLPSTLVDTENYYLAEVLNGKYVSITSDKYHYATLEDGVVHMSEITADDKTIIKICEDSYTEDESPMLFIDHYRTGGTFFLDNFTFCNWLNEFEIMTFYIPEGTVVTGAVAIK